MNRQQKEIQTVYETLTSTEVTKQDSSAHLDSDQELPDMPASAGTGHKNVGDRTATIIPTRTPDRGLDGDSELHFLGSPLRPY